MCPIHGTELAIVCGVPTCGRCYEAGLLAAPMPKLKQKVQVEVRYVESAHRAMPLRKRGPT